MLKVSELAPRNRGSRVRAALVVASALALGGCAAMSASGPTTGQIEKFSKDASSYGIRVIDVTEVVARRVSEAGRPKLFSDTLGDAMPVGAQLAPGDQLDITVWEAPPASLFGATGLETRSTGGLNQASKVTALPEQMIDSTGRINVPFAGSVQAAGRTPREIEADITNRLRYKAHLPQVQVRLIRNATADVTVVGEVAQSLRMPLSPKGERLLDALAAAGGLRQPLGKTSVQVTRGNVVQVLPMDTVVRDPRQNIVLKSGDVVTALFQPYSFTVLGAAVRNEEVNFEAQGITLSQALGRVGGLQDSRANARGIFIFRLENPQAVDATALAAGPLTPEGKVPVIYRINLKDPATFFIAQSFPIRDDDVLYISNAPLADFQKFVGIVSSLVFPVLSVENSLNNN
ncbi:polysaccharide biosynthesis/export family protein [Sphingobium aquiterrae]|uniref:polysaccharide biosynthesis/export family protein n=1 Tax=Sphingobium aquiterrae TaxID=2038656 RepID=UPI0030174DED